MTHTPKELEVLKEAAHDVYNDPYGGIEGAIDFLIDELTGKREGRKFAAGHTVSEQPDWTGATVPERMRE